MERFLKFDPDSAQATMERLDIDGVHIIGVGPSDSFRLRSMSTAFGSEPGVAALAELRRGARRKKTAQD